MKVREQLATGERQDATNISNKYSSLIHLKSLKLYLLVFRLQWCNLHGELWTKVFLSVGCLRLEAFCYTISIASVAW